MGDEREEEDPHGEVYKWKVRLNVHGGKQTHGVDYWETNAAAQSGVQLDFSSSSHSSMGGTFDKFIFPCLSAS